MVRCGSRIASPGLEVDLERAREVERHLPDDHQDRRAVRLDPLDVRAHVAEADDVVARGRGEGDVERPHDHWSGAAIGERPHDHLSFRLCRHGHAAGRRQERIRCRLVDVEALEHRLSRRRARREKRRDRRETDQPNHCSLGHSAAFRGSAAGTRRRRPPVTTANTTSVRLAQPAGCPAPSPAWARDGVAVLPVRDRRGRDAADPVRGQRAARELDREPAAGDARLVRGRDGGAARGGADLRPRLARAGGSSARRRGGSGSAASSVRSTCSARS